MITKEDVEYLANMGQIEISETQIDKYQKELNNMLKATDKIKDVEIDVDNNITFINPGTNKNIYREDVVGEMPNISEILKNAPKTNGNYIEVPGVINE